MERTTSDFNGFICDYRARFDALEIFLEDAAVSSIDAGALPPILREVLARNGFPIGDNCILNQQDGKWLVLDENGEQRAYIRLSDNQASLNVASRFVGELVSFNIGQVGILMLDDAYVKAEATFNALHCNAGAFFRNTRFDGPVDFKYGEYGINLQMEGAQVRLTAAFEGILIHRDLVIEMAVFHEGADFTTAKIRRLRIGTSEPFRKKMSVFSGCTFDFFEGDWRMLVDQQDPDRFSLDPYSALEHCFRAAGNHRKADDIYHTGQSYETRLAFRQRPAIFLTRMLRSFFTGYGVRPFRSAIFCVLVVALGVVIYWSDDALRHTIPRDTAQLSQSSFNAVNDARETCKIQVFGDSSNWMKAHQTRSNLFGFDMSVDGPALDRFISRLAYSVDEFVPVDLGITELCSPAPGWRQIYSAFQILSGWILIPLLVAAATGFLGKR